MTEDPDGIAGRRIRLPGPASPPPEELTGAELTGEVPGLPLGGRLDLAEITGLTLKAIVPGFAEGAACSSWSNCSKGASRPDRRPEERS